MLYFAWTSLGQAASLRNSEIVIINRVAQAQHEQASTYLRMAQRLAEEALAKEKAELRTQLRLLELDGSLDAAEKTRRIREVRRCASAEGLMPRSTPTAG